MLDRVDGDCAPRFIVFHRNIVLTMGEIFGDEITAAAMVDRLVHHAEILSLERDNYRLKDPTSAASRRSKTRPPRRVNAPVASRSRSPYGLGSTRSRHSQGWSTFRVLLIQRG